MNNNDMFDGLHAIRMNEALYPHLKAFLMYSIDTVRNRLIDPAQTNSVPGLALAQGEAMAYNRLLVMFEQELGMIMQSRKVDKDNGINEAGETP